MFEGLLVRYPPETLSCALGRSILHLVLAQPRNKGKPPDVTEHLFTRT